MKTRKFTIALIASIAIFATACGNNDEHDGHNHVTETTQIDVETEKQSENETLADASGGTIFGCPMHKDMIGSEGDKCPKCNYMEMIPVTWSLD